MKRIAIILLALILGNSAPVSMAQSSTQSDLHLNELIAAPDDTAKVTLLLKASRQIARKDPEKAISYAKSAVEVARRIEDRKGYSESNYFLGNLYSMNQENDQAIVCLLEALPYQKSANLIEGESTIYNNISAIYQELSNFPKALEYALNSLRLFEKNKNLYGQARCQTNIGNLYSSNRDYSNAIRYYNMALQINKSNNWEEGIALVEGNLGDLYRLMNQYDKAKEYCKGAIALYRKLNLPEGIERNTGTLGEILLKEKKYDEALIAFNEALAITHVPENNLPGAYDFMGLAAVYLGIAENNLAGNSSYQKLNLDHKKAIALARIYADSAVTQFEEIGDLSALSNSLNLLSKAQAAAGDFAGAYSNQVRFKILNDSVFNIEKDKKLTQTSMQYEFDKKEESIRNEQEKKNIQQRNIRNSIAGGLGGALIFLFVVYRQRNKIAKEKKRSDELLTNILPAETAEELKRTGTTKARDFNQVTVMFTDFKNFTSISMQLSAQELVNEINYCYSAFDEIITRNGIEKIKTIGDSYMCAGGLPVPNTTNANDTVIAALEIRDFMLNEKKKREAIGKPFFEIRIGCHTGSVVAGIVGIKKFAFDIWGDTVNTASRMESSGEPGKVNISESTYALIKDDFNCVYRGKIEVKNKGAIEMYFVDTK